MLPDQVTNYTHRPFVVGTDQNLWEAFVSSMQILRKGRVDAIGRYDMGYLCVPGNAVSCISDTYDIDSTKSLPKGKGA
jgi:hypothetical protein